MDFLLGSLAWARFPCKSWPKKNGKFRVDINGNIDGNINGNINGKLAWIVAGDPKRSQWGSISLLKCVPLTLG